MERMRRRRKWVRRIGRAVGTVAIGVMLGFLVPTIITDFSPEPEIQARAAESPVARQFIEAYLADDQSVLDALKVGSDVKLRATRFRAEYSKVDAPIHLGSTVGGGFSLHGYAAHVVRSDGTDGLLSWRVATAGGQVILIGPPAPIEAAP
jgi:hypothetical protein